MAFYVVLVGKEPGIYQTWNECEEQVKGFKGAKFKKFKLEEEAKKAFFENSFDKKDCINKIDIKKEYPKKGLAVDGACSGNPGVGEYQIFDFEKNKMIFTSTKYYDVTNNLMEYMALIQSLIISEDYDINYDIYSDSVTAMAWLRNKKVNTTVKKTDLNKVFFDDLNKCEKWLKNKIIKNNIIKWNTKLLGEIPADFGRK